MVKIMSRNSCKTHIFIDGTEIGSKVNRIRFDQTEKEVPVFTFEIEGFPDIESDNALVCFEFTPETIKDAAEVLIHSFDTNKTLYDAFVSSVLGAIENLNKTQNGMTDLELARHIVGRIIGKE